MIKKFKDFCLNEDTLATIKRTVKVVFDVESTYHSKERQSRHIAEGGTYITDEELIKTTSKFMEILASKLIQGEIKLGQELLLFDSSNDLNIVCILNDDKKSNNIDMTLITIMRKKDFKNSKNTYEIKI